MIEEIINNGWASVEAITDNELDNVTTTVTSQIAEAANTYRSMNREQRRTVKKKMGKKGRENVDLISDTARKLNYVDLIQKLRKLNKEKENENYENPNQDN